MIYNCSYSNPRWILKSGEVRTLEPLETAGTNADFQFSSSTCEIQSATSSIVSIENGFSHGEIVMSVFLFLIFMVSIYNFYWRTIHEKIDEDL